MTPDQQEKFFQRVRARYPHWKKEKVSGYVHGVQDEARLKQPAAEQLDQQTYGFITSRASQYAIGYVDGFADARGEDVLNEKWWKTFGTKLEYRWWKYDATL